MSILIDTEEGLYSMKDEELSQLIGEQFNNFMPSKVDEKLKSFILKEVIESLQEEERYYDLPQLKHHILLRVKKYKGF